MTADFPCGVVHVHDGDGPMWCLSGEKLRIAGVQAPDFTDTDPCRKRKPGYVCDDRLAAASQHIAAKLVMGKTLQCRKVGVSYRRVVADCTLPNGTPLRCQIIASAAAVRWDKWWRQYRLGECS